MTLESWFSNLEQTPTRQVSLQALFKLLARYSRHVFKQRTEQNNLIIPISTDLHHLSLIANNITAKLTIPFTRPGRITLDWQQLFNRLWWWLLPLRLPTRQSPLPTEFLFGTTVTRTIKLHDRMCLLFLHVRLLSLKDTGADIVYCWKTWMISLVHSGICAIVKKNGRSCTHFLKSRGISFSIRDSSSSTSLLFIRELSERATRTASPWK